MTKTELVKQIANATDLTLTKADEVITAFQTLTAKALSEGDTIELPLLGKFGVKIRAARTGRHPQTQKTLHIPEKKVVYFKLGSKLKAAVAD